jgi:hypothetical protein
MNSRVRTLALDLRIPAADPNGVQETRREIEEVFLAGVLNALESRIHSRLGAAAIVRVRNLKVAWTLRRSQLSDSGYAERLGYELADDLEAALARPPDPRRPMKSEGIVAFEDEAHLTAARLTVEAAGDADDWMRAGAVDDAGAWTFACAGGPRRLEQTLSRLARMGTVETVIARLERGQIAQALAVLPAEAWPRQAQRALAAAIAGAAEGGMKAVDGMGPVADSGMTSATKAGAGRAEVAPPRADEAAIERVAPPVPGADRDAREQRTSGRQAPWPPADRPVDGDADGAVPAGRSARPARDGAPPAILTRLQKVRPERADTAARSVAPAGDISRQHAPERADAATSSVAAAGGDALSPGSAPVPPSASSPPNAATPALDAAMFAIYPTRFAGLFYLLNPIIALDLPEILWCAGALEGAFLRHVARVLLGPEGLDDPAPSILDGAAGITGLAGAELPAWAAAEIGQKARAALAAYCGHCGIAAQPADELAATIDALAETLPLPAGIGDAASTKAVADVAAIALYAFGIRLGERLDRIGFVERIRIDGRIECDPPTIRVVMPMDAIDIRIRLAGLDFNPGYLPWLKQRLVFVFEEYSAADG